MGNNDTNFLNLNVDNRWAGFRWRGLDLMPDGSLQLCSLPLLQSGLPTAPVGSALPDGPSGVAVDRSGNVFFSVPSEHKIMRVDGCDGAVEPVACLGLEGGAPRQFRFPRGLLIPKQRPSLFVADSGNHRVQIIDLASGQLTGVWGLSNAVAAAGSDLPGLFNTPWALVGDAEGSVYVLDYGNRRVQKFDPVGDVVASFAENVHAADPELHPTDLTVADCGDGKAPNVLILDSVHGVVGVFDSDGRAVLDAAGAPLRLSVPVQGDSAVGLLGLAAAGNRIFVGDNTSHRVLQVKRGREVEVEGEAIGFAGVVTALALDRKGRLLVHGGTAAPPCCLSTGGAYRRRGIAWSDAISIGPRKARWHRARATLTRASAEGALRLYFCTGSDQSNPPTVDVSLLNPFEAAGSRWRPVSGPAGGLGDLDEIFLGEESAFVWVGALLSSGDGKTTPVLKQIRVEFDHVSLMERLPAIYQRNGPDRDFLLRLVSLIEGAFGDVEDEITGMSRLFAPYGTHRQDLPWLGSWLGVDIDETWDENLQRRAVADAFARAGRRGTAAGLREALQLFAGVNAVIEEPILNTSWWGLPPAGQTASADTGQESAQLSCLGAESSALGFTTMLASSSVQGAVLGTSATLDRSKLISGENMGAPLFEDLANCVRVNVYCGQLGSKEKQTKLRAVLDRELPGHVLCELSVIEPRFRVGYQARVGVDAVVGGGATPGQLDASFVLNSHAELGPDLRASAGAQDRVGQVTVRP